MADPSRISTLDREGDRRKVSTMYGVMAARPTSRGLLFQDWC